MNKLLAKILFFSTIIILGFSCGKEETDIPLTLIGEPVFKFEGEIDGVPIDLEAGIDGYYMNSNYRLSPDTVFQFIGELKKIDCNENCQKVSLIINDSGVHEEQDVSISSALNYSIYDYQWNSLTYGFCCINEAQYYIDYYTWYVDGVEMGSGQYFEHSFPAEGDYNVMCVARYASGCSDTTKVFVQTSIPYCLPIFYPIWLDTAFLNMYYYIPSNNIVNVNWNFGDGTTSSSTNYYIEHEYSEYSNVKVCAEIETTDCEGEYCRYVKVGNSSCVSNVCYGPIYGDNLYSKIILEYIDENGKEYTTKSSEHQPIESYFHLLDSEPYIDNLNGQKSYKITANLQCKLYNKENASDQIILTNALLTFAISYPD